jgi:sulfate adenylyltransferase subunit 1
MNEKKLLLNGKYAIKHTSKEARCVIKEIKYKVDINTLHRLEEDKEIGLNDIARVSLRTTQPFFYDKYKINRATGSIILIDESTNETVGAGMII